MYIVIIIFTLQAALFEYIRTKKLYNPVVVMFFYWSLLVLFASMQLFNLQKISFFAYALMLIGLISFYSGYLVSQKYMFRLVKREQSDTTSVYVLRYKLLYCLYTIVILYLIYNAINIIILLQSGYSMITLRSLYSNQIGNAKGYNVVLQSAGNVVFNLFVSTPVVYMSISVLVVNVFSNKKDRLLIILTVFMLGLWMITSGGGRSVAIWLAIQFVAAKFIYGKKINIPPQIKRMIWGFLILFGVLFIYLTTQRKGEDVNIWKEIYIYFPVGLKNFDYHIQEFKNNFHYMLGASSFYGFIYPVIFILTQTPLMHDYPQWILDAKYISFTSLEPNVFIGLNMNAYVTIFYQPYTDFGIVGIILFLFAFGVIVTQYYKKSIETQNMRDVAIYLYFFQKICFSQVRFYFCQVQQVIALLLLLFIVFKKESIDNELYDQKT